jgi:nucleoside-diphosphate-sugar epimerase
MAYVENVASFLRYAMTTAPGVHTYNYVDKPDFTMNELIGVIDAALGQPGRKRPHLPYGLGLVLGHAVDVLARLSGKRFPISAIRVKKFCADSSYSTAISRTDFKAPVSLEQALTRTIRYEFVEKHDQQQLFYSE